jgi:hypothetical protein
LNIKLNCQKRSDPRRFSLIEKVLRGFKLRAAFRVFEAEKLRENEKEAKSCHQCGLEAIDDCETENKHIPFSETLPPCRFCVRNRKRPKVSMIADFWDEMWTLDTDKTPIIEDSDPHDQNLLKLLHDIIGGGRIGK